MNIVGNFRREKLTVGNCGGRGTQQILREDIGAGRVEHSEERQHL